MIGKAEWFKRRKYGGWGITPKSWQGWIYILLFLIVIVIGNLLLSNNTKVLIIFTISWIVILMIDVFDIMIHMKKDERNKIHEAISERNALWGIMIILVVGILYQILSSALSKTIKIDWWIVVALAAGVIIKSISNFYLERRN